MKAFKLITLLWLALAATTLRADVYIAGHADIGAGFEGGNLHLHLHAHDPLTLFGGGSTPVGVEEFEPSDLIIGVPGPSLARSAGTQWNFLAANAGDATWRLPQNSNPAKPFLGVGLEELDVADWVGPLTWQFNSISTVLGASSAFSLYQVDGDGNPIVFASTLLPTSGVAGFGANSWNQNPGGHDHYNFGFTAEGIYDVSFSITGTSNGSGAVPAGTFSDTATFRFATGSFIQVAAVPEPSAALLLSLALGSVLMRRRR